MVDFESGTLVGSVRGAGNSGAGGQVAFGPGVGQEGSHVGRFGRELAEQVNEVVPRIDGVPFGAGAEAQQDRGGPEPGVARDEEPVAASMRISA